MKLYNLIEEGQVHTDALKLKDAEEMLERYQATYPNLDFWIEPMIYRTKHKFL